MFDEVSKYKNNGHFFFRQGDVLKEASKDVPDLPGVFIIYRLAKGKVDVVYIGSSGATENIGVFKKQLLSERINVKQEGLSRQDYFDKKMKAEKIDALDIYWYVTFDEKHQDIPEFVKGQLIQRYFEVHGKLPPWNKDF